MFETIYNKLKTVKLWNLLWISLVLSEVFTAIMDILIGLIWHGRIDLELMLIGAIDAFVVALFVSIILILIFREIRNYEGHSEEAILNAKDEWERTFDSMTDLIMILDTKHKVVRTNKAMAEKLKLTPLEAVGITCYEHVHGLTEPPSFCPHAMCMSDGRGHSVEVYEERLGGHYLVTVTPLFNAKREVVGSVHTAKDITERKRSEIAMRETNAARERQLQFTETLLKAIPISVFFKDAEGRYLGCNQEFTKIMGVTSEDIAGKTVFELWPGEQSEMYHRKDLELLQNPEHQSYEFQVTDCRGAILDVVFNKHVFMDENGEVGGIIGAFLDISARKRAEEKLRETNTMLHALLHAIPEMIYFKDAQNRYLLANKATEDFTGLSQGQLMGRTDEELLPPELAKDCRVSDDAVARTLKAVRFEEQFAGADKKRFLDTIKAPVFDDRGNLAGLVGVSRDITERKQIEQSLQQNEEKFRTLFEAASDALFIIDMDGTILDVNAVAYERLGYTKEELLSLHLSQLDHPSYATILPERMERMKQYGRITIESAHVKKDGSVMPVEINARTMDLKGEKVIFSVIRDITERKQAEQSLLEKTQRLEDLSRDLEKRVAAEIRVRIKSERMMIQQSKLAAMGEMLGAIAHQWRQPLNVVGLIVQNMEDAHAFGKLDKEYLEKMVEKAMAQILRMSKTIDDFRGFYKPDKEKTVFDAMRAVGDVLSLVSAQLVGDSIITRLTCHTHGKTFENECDIVCCDEKTVKGFKNEFEHVILNLVNNARDAILEKRERDGSVVQGLLSLDFYHTGGTVLIKVSDNGAGIPPEAIDRIFDPYFTTKDPTKGTGLGLYMSKVIVEDHMGGKLSAENADGGAILSIELPQLGNGAHHENAKAV